jgi:hypothetical protein
MFQHGCNDIFVKVELRGGPCKYKPRIISNVNPSWVACVGPYLHLVDEHIRRVGAFGHAKYWTAVQQAEWIRTHAMLEFLDMKTCDLSLSELLFRAELLLWEAFGLPTEISRLILNSELKWKARKKFSDYRCAFRVHGRARQSGDPQTSCGNNHIVIMAHAFIAVFCHGLYNNLGNTWYMQDRRVMDLSFLDLMNNGDDAVLHSHLDGYDTRHYALLGMEVECTRGEFCQAKDLDLGDRITMVRHPREVLSRVGYSTAALPASNPIARRTYIAGVAVGMSYFCSRVPIYATLFRTIYNLAGVTPLTINSDSYTVRCWLEAVKATPCMQFLDEPTPLGRAEFARAFDIPPSLQVEVEQAIANLPSLYGFIDVPGLDGWFREQWEGQDSGVFGI